MWSQVQELVNVEQLGRSIYAAFEQNPLHVVLEVALLVLVVVLLVQKAYKPNKKETLSRKVRMGGGGPASRLLLCEDVVGGWRCGSAHQSAVWMDRCGFVQEMDAIIKEWKPKPLAKDLTPEEQWMATPDAVMTGYAPSYRRRMFGLSGWVRAP